jgi:hypothetical protein
MRQSFSRRLLNNIVSPYGLAIISYSIFLCGSFVPPSFYSYYINEPDMMFLDPASILLYTLCTAAFILGLVTIGTLFPSRPLFQEKVQSIKTKFSPAVFILLPLIFGTVFADWSRSTLLKKNPMIVLSLFTLQGETVKSTTLDTSGSFDIATMLLIGIVWWAVWRFPELELKKWKRVLIGLVIAFAILSVIFSALVTLSRSQAMMFLCGLAVLYVIRKQLEKKMTWRFVGLASLAFACFILLFFFLFSFLRGKSTWDVQISTLLGYTVGSYNRMAAVLNGSLHYPYAGHGIYLSFFIALNNSFHKVFPIDQWMHWPTYMELFNTESGAVDKAGLLGYLFWSGAFGYIFSDIGWFTPLFLFGYGLMYGVVWRWMKEGKAIGAILYPCFAFCVLFWLGTNYLLASDPAVLLLVAIFFTGYEFFCVRRVKPPHQVLLA